MKISLSLLPPFTLRLLGLGSGALLLFLLARLRRADILPARAWPGIVAGGLLSIAVFNLAVAWAQLSTSTARAAVLTFTMPMMSALLARFVLGERLDGRRAWRCCWADRAWRCWPGRRCGRRHPAPIRPRCADWCSP